jgi:NADH-quinone oxidoreductase subunit F
LERIYHRILSGNGSESDVKLLESVSKQMQGETLCALGEFATSPVLSTIRHFPEEYYDKVSKPAESGS